MKRSSNTDGDKSSPDKKAKATQSSSLETQSEEQNEENPTRVVPIESHDTDDLDHEQHADKMIDEHHGHEERLNALHRKQSKRAKLGHV